jgi:hypothetical protein
VPGSIGGGWTTTPDRARQARKLRPTAPRSASWLEQAFDSSRLSHLISSHLISSSPGDMRKPLVQLADDELSSRADLGAEPLSLSQTVPALRLERMQASLAATTASTAPQMTTASYTTALDLTLCVPLPEDVPPSSNRASRRSDSQRGRAGRGLQPSVRRVVARDKRLERIELGPLATRSCQVRRVERWAQQVCELHALSEAAEANSGLAATSWREGPGDDTIPRNGERLVAQPLLRAGTTSDWLTGTRPPRLISPRRCLT